jgi:hypothetical protein
MRRNPRPGAAPSLYGIDLFELRPSSPKRAVALERSARIFFLQVHQIFLCSQVCYQNEPKEHEPRETVHCF